jgi:hypothetical protein
METNIGSGVVMPKQSKWVRGSVIAAIVIVMNLFFNYAVSFVYNEPSYDQYVKPVQVIGTYTRESCVEAGGQWTEDMNTPTKNGGYCYPDYTNQKNYDAAKKIYDRNVFVTLVVLGVISLVIGAFVKVSILSVAFSWGGVLSLIIASMRYWGSADKLFKVIILAIALGLLIWLAVKKFSK